MPDATESEKPAVGTCWRNTIRNANGYMRVVEVLSDGVLKCVRVDTNALGLHQATIVRFEIYNDLTYFVDMDRGDGAGEMYEPIPESAYRAAVAPILAELARLAGVGEALTTGERNV